MPRAIQRALLCALFAAVLAVPAAASAKVNKKLLWATVNVCDTAAHPNGFGIRGSIPGDGHQGRMYMRFRVQYFAAADQKWHNSSSSHLMSVGSSRYRSRQSGRTFLGFTTPAAGGSYLLRGKIEFRWKRHGKTVRKASRLTTAGHKTKQAEPAGYSSDTCEIK